MAAARCWLRLGPSAPCPWGGWTTRPPPTSAWCRAAAPSMWCRSTARCTPRCAAAMPPRSQTQVEAMIAALELGAAEAGVDVQIDVREHFRGYRHDEDAAALRLAATAIEQAGLAALLVEAAAAQTATSSTRAVCRPSPSGSATSTCTRPQECMALHRLAQLYDVAHSLVRVAADDPGAVSRARTRRPPRTRTYRSSWTTCASSAA